ncbi:hypothetical protein ADUPG1_008414 [Aduncisulcus paluster]|uniref:Uncharacterized protein n=1 Tax=Aduncisulcus paluster TaxID=2918883 RepID=A0ABQ5KRW8_9EUKA|nr:hypothetical protein ADUPG1_008414 [Aduncisulcus paluster]
MLSEIPSIVPQLSPKFDDEMYWCMKNGGWRNYYSRYLGNCFASLKKWKELIDFIEKCADSESTAELFDEHRDEILSVFLEYQSESEIEEHKREIILCAQCLELFVRHVISGNEIYLPNSDLNDLIDIFIDHLSRVEQVLEGDVDEEYCRICAGYTFKVEYKLDSFLPKISSTFHRILERGSDKKLRDEVTQNLLITLKNISISPTSSARYSILTLIKPYIRDWLRIYNDSECYGHWMIILSKNTLSSDDETPDKSLCSEAWPLFHPVLDVVKREFVGDKIVEDNHEWVLRFFSNLCCDSLHSLEIFDNIKELLDEWFETIKRKEYQWGITLWSNFISVFSTIPSLFPQICPKFDANMEWCKNNGALWGDYSRYLSNSSPSCHNLIELLNLIRHCPDSTSTSKLYYEYKHQLLSEFLSRESNCDIEEHQREIILCVQCLDEFVRHIISGNEIYLPNSDLNDLIDTFIDHLSRVEQVLEGDIDEDYCRICVSYSFKVEDKRDSFLPKISPTFHRILERGSKEKLGGNVARDLLATLVNISYSPSSSTRSSILTLIKPYIGGWLRIYNDSKCYGEWMFILSHITLSSDSSGDETPDKSLCSEAWPLFHPVLDVVKREFVGDKIVEDDHEKVLLFFSNLCCDPLHALEIYDNVKDLLDVWFTVIKKKKHKWGIKPWPQLISMFSTVPSLVHCISPKYDVKMMKSWFFDRYFSNISSYIASSCLSKLLHSIPPVSLIPSIETSLCPEKDGYSYASHVCCQMSVETDADFINCDVFNYRFSTSRMSVEIDDDFSNWRFYNLNKTSVVNIITKKEMTDQQIIQRGRLCFGTKDEHPDDVGKRRFSSLGIEEPSHTLSSMMGTMKKGSINSHIHDKMLDGPSSQKKQSTLMGKKQEAEEEKNSIISFEHNYRIKHSSIIQYTPPQHLLVKMPFDEERSLRQSVYDFVEHTGGGVESLFDHEMCNVSFEGYDQESWREEMEILEEEEEEKGEEEEVDGHFTGDFDQYMDFFF